MANLKSSKKDVKRIKIRTMRNRSRMSELKTLIKKFSSAVQASSLEEANQLFRLAQSKLARAKGKGLLKANTVSRKISSLASKLGSVKS